MDSNDAMQLWSTLGGEGKAPTELSWASNVLPSYSVGIDTWLDRLERTYLRSLCRQAPHFKLVLAPYGGGKTHFLMALGSRGLAEGFAVAYVPCGSGVSLDSPLDIYKVVTKHLRLPDVETPGIRSLLGRVLAIKRAQIEESQAPDQDAALRLWISNVGRQDFPENAFGRVVAAALLGITSSEHALIGDAAVRWLQGDVDTLTRDELSELRLAKIPARQSRQLGQNLLLSLVQFVRSAKVHGLVLLLDEVETLFTARGKALLRILAAMRVLVDIPNGVPGGMPLLGVFSAVPDVVDEMSKYPALEQRFAVRGASFEEGNDFATQLPLESVSTQETLLEAVGRKLIEVGELATGHVFDRDIQVRNATLLAAVAAARSLDVNARRVYVKTWVGLLEIQLDGGERVFDEDELSRRYQGSFDALRERDEANDGDFEP